MHLGEIEDDLAGRTRERAVQRRRAVRETIRTEECRHLRRECRIRWRCWNQPCDARLDL
jgi:hypothetical protein